MFRMANPTDDRFVWAPDQELQLPTGISVVLFWTLCKPLRFGAFRALP